MINEVKSYLANRYCLTEGFKILKIVEKETYINIFITFNDYFHPCIGFSIDEISFSDKEAVLCLYKKDWTDLKKLINPCLKFNT